VRARPHSIVTINYVATLAVIAFDVEPICQNDRLRFYRIGVASGYDVSNDCAYSCGGGGTCTCSTYCGTSGPQGVVAAAGSELV
jgi:hypothetical protein